MGGARFWTPAVLRGRVVAFGPEGRETVYFRGFGPVRFCVEVSLLLVSEGRETVARAYFRGLWQ